MIHSPRNRSGFTLVEVALAATILLVGFAGMATALMVGSEMLDTARKQTIATQIMQGEIERLHMLSWSDPDLSVTTAPQDVKVMSDSSVAILLWNHNNNITLPTPPAPVKVKELSLLFQCVREVQDVHPGELRQITLTASWTSITGKPHSRSCNAYIGKNGLNVSYQKQ